MTNIFHTIIIPASLAPLARALGAGLSPAGAGMFVTPLYDATNTITHYISSGWIGEEFGTLITDADLLFEACAGAATIEQCTALVSQSTVSTDEPHSLIATMGLTLSGVAS